VAARELVEEGPNRSGIYGDIYQLFVGRNARLSTVVDTAF
jgi:hypothetical protein